MGLRGKVARLRVKQRRQDRARSAKQIERLTRQRNKALREAEDAERLAKARKEKLDAEQKRADARAHLQAGRRQKRDKLLGDIGKGLRRIGKGLMEEPKKKPRKRKTTTTKTRKKR